MSTTQPSAEHEGPLSRPHAWRDLLIVGSPIVVMGGMGNLMGGSTLRGGAVINLGYVVMIVVGMKLLERQGSSWKDLGLQRPASWGKTILMGGAALIGALFLFVAAQNLAAAGFEALGLGPGALDQSRFNPIQGNLPLFALMIVLSWTTIAFGEELFYRAFLISRMVDVTSIGSGPAIVIAGLVFGVVHFAEGPVGMLANASFGIFFGWMYLRSHRNVWITVIAHGLLNTLRFSLLFAGAV